MRPSKARSELSVGLAFHMRWVTYEGAVHLRPVRQTPEVGAGCGKAARPVLCGGRIAICVPTAIPNPGEAGEVPLVRRTEIRGRKAVKNSYNPDQTNTGNSFDSIFSMSM